MSTQPIETLPQVAEEPDSQANLEPFQQPSAHWPEELYPQIYGMYLRYGGLSLQSLVKKNEINEHSPEIAQSISNLGNLSMNVAIDLKAKIPRREFSRLERQRIKDASEQSRQGEDLSERPLAEFNLTEKETPILSLMMSGLTDQAIADTLSLSKNTVQYRVKSILEKTGTGDRLQAALLSCEALADSPHKSEFIPQMDLGWTKDLSKAELRIFMSAKKGLTNSELAAKLGISVETLKTHIGNIYEKSGVTNRVQLAVASWLAHEGSDKNQTHDASTANLALLRRRRIQTEPFWGENEPTPPERLGRLRDWTARALEMFADRPLGTSDLAKILHAEDWDNLPHSKLSMRILSMTGEEEWLEKRMQAQGFKYLKKMRSDNGDYRHIAFAEGSTLDLENIDDTMRPTDEELRQVARQIRLEEMEHQRQQAHIASREREQKEIEKQKRQWSTRGGRIADFLISHQGEYLIYKDIIRDVYPKHYEDGRIMAAKSGLQKLIKRGIVDKFLAQEDLRLYTALLDHNGPGGKHAVLVCLPVGEEPSWGSENHSERSPSPANEVLPSPATTRQEDLVTESNPDGTDWQEGEELYPPRKRRISNINSKQGRSLRAPLMIKTKAEKASEVSHFITSAIKALGDIVKALPQYHRPEPGQTFALSSETMLKELLGRGIITTEQFDAGEVDRAAAVAAVIIKARQDNGFLSGKQAQEGMDIIRREEERYFEALNALKKASRGRF